MSKQIVKKSPIDFKAKIIVYGLPEMKKKDLKSMIKWMSRIVSQMEKDPSIYAKRYIAKLMK